MGRIIRNAFIIGAFVAFIFIVVHFLSGNYIGERLEGTWRAVCVRDEITFAGSDFTRGGNSGEFRIRANIIHFCDNCKGYPIRITADYLWINGIHFLRVEC